MTGRWVWVIAGLLAFNLPAHVLYLGWVPGRIGWWLLWLGLTAALFPVVRVVAAWVVPQLRTGGLVAQVLPVVFGVALAGWWHGDLLDVLWLHGGRTRTLLLPILFASHAAAVAAIIALVVAALIATDPQPPDPVPRPPTPWLPVASFALVAGLFAGWYVGQERAVYPADYMYYWDRAAGWAERLRADPVAGADEFRRSVQRDGYTLLPVAPHALVALVIGDHRMGFVLTTVVAHLLPLALVSIAFVRLAAPCGRATLPTLLALGLFPGTWFPVLRGFPDVGGVVLAVGTLLVYLRRPAGGLCWHDFLSLAALLVGMTLFRRWYAFWVVAFGLMVGADCLLVAGRSQSWRGIAHSLRPAVAVGVLLPMLLAAVALPGLRQMIGGDYSDAFSAYKADQAFNHRLADLACMIGPAYVVAFGLSVAVLAFGPGRRPALFVAGMVPIMLVHFMRVQDFNPHHQYLLLPALTLLPAAVIARWTRWTVVPLAAVCVALFSPVFVPAARWESWVRPLTTVLDGRPFRRHDLGEFRRLAAYLESRPADERYVVVSSSLDLHAGMVASLGRSLRVPIPSARQLPLQEVDKVNGFPTSVFAAGLVLVADPPQTHMRPAEQQTLLIPARHLLNGTGIGAAFDRQPEKFDFDGGVALRVFRRVRPLPPGTFDAFVGELRLAHPAHPVVFTPSSGFQPNPP